MFALIKSFLIVFVAVSSIFSNFKMSVFIMNTNVSIIIAFLYIKVKGSQRKRRTFIGNDTQWSIKTEVDDLINKTLIKCIATARHGTKYVKFIGGADDGTTDGNDNNMGSNGNGDVNNNDKPPNDANDKKDVVSGDQKPLNNTLNNELNDNANIKNINENNTLDKFIGSKSDAGKIIPTGINDNKHKIVKISSDGVGTDKKDEAYGEMYIKNHVASVSYVANELITTFDPFGAVAEIPPAYEVTPTAFRRRKILPSQMFEFMVNIVDRLAPQSVLSLTRHDFCRRANEYTTGVEWKIQQQVVLNDDTKSKLKDSFIYESDGIDLFFNSKLIGDDKEIGLKFVLCDDNNYELPVDQADDLYSTDSKLKREFITKWKPIVSARNMTELNAVAMTVLQAMRHGDNHVTLLFNMYRYYFSACIAQHGDFSVKKPIRYDLSRLVHTNDQTLREFHEKYRFVSMILETGMADLTHFIAVTASFGANVAPCWIEDKKQYLFSDMWFIPQIADSRVATPMVMDFNDHEPRWPKNPPVILGYIDWYVRQYNLNEQLQSAIDLFYACLCTNGCKGQITLPMPFYTVHHYSHLMKKDPDFRDCDLRPLDGDGLYRIFLGTRVFQEISTNFYFGLFNSLSAKMDRRWDLERCNFEIAKMTGTKLEDRHWIYKIYTQLAGFDLSFAKRCGVMDILGHEDRIAKLNPPHLYTATGLKRVITKCYLDRLLNGFKPTTPVTICGLIKVDEDIIRLHNLIYNNTDYSTNGMLRGRPYSMRNYEWRQKAVAGVIIEQLRVGMNWYDMLINADTIRIVNRGIIRCPDTVKPIIKPARLNNLTQIFLNNMCHSKGFDTQEMSDRHRLLPKPEPQPIAKPKISDDAITKPIITKKDKDIDVLERVKYAELAKKYSTLYVKLHPLSDDIEEIIFHRDSLIATMMSSYDNAHDITLKKVMVDKLLKKYAAMQGKQQLDGDVTPIDVKMSSTPGIVRVKSDKNADLIDKMIDDGSKIDDINLNDRDQVNKTCDDINKTYNGYVKLSKQLDAQGKLDASDAYIITNEAILDSKNSKIYSSADRRTVNNVVIHKHQMQVRDLLKKQPRFMRTTGEYSTLISDLTNFATGVARSFQQTRKVLAKMFHYISSVGLKAIGKNKNLMYAMSHDEAAYLLTQLSESFVSFVKYMEDSSVDMNTSVANKDAHLSNMASHLTKNLTTMNHIAEMIKVYTSTKNTSKNNTVEEVYDDIYNSLLPLQTNEHRKRLNVIATMHFLQGFYRRIVTEGSGNCGPSTIVNALKRDDPVLHKNITVEQVRKDVESSLMYHGADLGKNTIWWHRETLVYAAAMYGINLVMIKPASPNTNQKMMIDVLHVHNLFNTWHFMGYVNENHFEYLERVEVPELNTGNATLWNSGSSVRYLINLIAKRRLPLSYGWMTTGVVLDLPLPYAIGGSKRAIIADSVATGFNKLTGDDLDLFIFRVVGEILLRDPKFIEYIDGLFTEKTTLQEAYSHIVTFLTTHPIDCRHWCEHTVISARYYKIDIRNVTSATVAKVERLYADGLVRAELHYLWQFLLCGPHMPHVDRRISEMILQKDRKAKTIVVNDKIDKICKRALSIGGARYKSKKNSLLYKSRYNKKTDNIRERMDESAIRVKQDCILQVVIKTLMMRDWVKRPICSCCDYDAEGLMKFSYISDHIKKAYMLYNKHQNNERMVDTYLSHIHEVSTNYYELNSKLGKDKKNINLKKLILMWIKIVHKCEKMFDDTDVIETLSSYGIGNINTYRDEITKAISIALYREQRSTKTLCIGKILWWISNTIDPKHIAIWYEKFSIFDYCMDHYVTNVKVYHELEKNQFATFTLCPDLSPIEHNQLLYLHTLVGRYGYSADWTHEINRRIAVRDEAYAVDQSYGDFYRNLKIFFDKMFTRCKKTQYVSWKKWCDMRYEWVASGAASGEKNPYTIDEIRSVYSAVTEFGNNKRVWMERHPANELLQFVKDNPPFMLAYASSKMNELGKTRALYATETRHYMIHSYLIKMFEHCLTGSIVDIRAKGDERIRTMQRFQGYCRKLMACNSFDYSDFNYHHTFISMYMLHRCIVNKIIEDCPDEVSNDPDFRMVTEWLVKSCCYQFFYLRDRNVIVRTSGGMFSGNRATTIINTMLNHYYAHAINEYKLRNYGNKHHYDSLYHGDDYVGIYDSITNSNLFNMCAAKCKFEANPSKLLQGYGIFEYLRNLYYPDGSVIGNVTRSIGSFVSGNWESHGKIRFFERIRALWDQCATLKRRGMNPYVCEKLFESSMEYWGRITTGYKTRSNKLSLWYVYSCCANGGLGLTKLCTGKMYYGNHRYPDLAVNHRKCDFSSIPNSGFASRDYIKHLNRDKLPHWCKIRDEDVDFVSNILMEQSIGTGIADPEFIDKIDSTMISEIESVDKSILSHAVRIAKIDFYDYCELYIDHEKQYCNRKQFISCANSFYDYDLASWDDFEVSTREIELYKVYSIIGKYVTFDAGYSLSDLWKYLHIHDKIALLSMENLVDRWDCGNISSVHMKAVKLSAIDVCGTDNVAQSIWFGLVGERADIWSVRV